jgi:Z1 domain/Type III restriction enzyme, res subunit
MSVFDISKLRKAREVKRSRYQRQLERIRSKNGSSETIEKAVSAAIKNVFDDKCRSFVIYGEPQSGKTEMMIALTAALLDRQANIIILLLNDSVQLLTQNLERFRRSYIDPAPKNFSEVLDPSIKIGNNEWIIFCKKNSKDLQKLIAKIGKLNGKIIVDDEADYATPNSKVNKGEKTKINNLVGQLIGKDGVYIGVTATPARLDLNNTFNNENEKWVDFLPHALYKGQRTFFPTATTHTDSDRFSLVTLPDAGDDPKYLREALFYFLINVAYLNTKINIEKGEKNYSILIHTSGKKADHSEDYRQTVALLSALNNPDDSHYEKYYKQIWEIARSKYEGDEDGITAYIANNVSRYTIVVMNSETDKNVVDYTSATNPSTLFTVAIGGNIVSRGVTFDNLLSMFFTRDVKHRIQQDTYIQRARMFGTRGEYLPFFQLSIPEKLYMDWHKCFVFHRLSLESIRAGNGSPVWLEDTRVATTAGASIDKATISMDSGEMSFELFDYKELEIDAIIRASGSPLEKLEDLAILLGEQKVPKFLREYIRNFSPDGSKSVAIHPSRTIKGSKDADQAKIERAKGFLGKFELEEDKYPHAIHHIKVLFNEAGRARVFYKYSGSIKFLKNLRGNKGK